MKQNIKFFTILGLIICLTLLTANNFRQNFQSHKQLSDKQNELHQLQNTFGNKQTSSNFIINTDHNENLQILAAKYVTINKTRTEKNSENTDLFIDFSSDFQKSLLFINHYLKNDFQHALKQIKMSALEKNKISVEINFGDNL